MKEEKAFSSVDLVGQCLLDEERTKAFKLAIEQVVRPGMCVVDAGTGSGIFAMYAARAGAAKVYAIELDPYIASIARKNIAVNGLESVIEVIEADARLVSFPTETKIDVLIMEMLTTGMIDEFQVPAISHMREARYISTNTIFLPREQQSFLTLGTANFDFDGVFMPMVLHTWYIHMQENPRFNPLSNKVLYDSMSFANVSSALGVDASVNCKIKKVGTINAALLESVSVLNDVISLGETQALNGTVVVPLMSLNCKEDDTIKTRLRYTYGHGFENLNINLSQ